MRFAVYEARTGKKRNLNRVFEGKPEKKKHLENVGVYEGKILIYILSQQGGRART
jgi:hypothetical protein